MSFVGLYSILVNFIAKQSIEPGTIGFFGNIWAIVGNVVMDFLQSVCSIFYVVCKWFLAVVDFLQYFIQKLIGLDYWLNIRTGEASIEGAIEADLLFSFLYNETVQNVFRAMMGVFFILLIVFTIFAIIKQEWTFATSGFEGGDGNSKMSIFRGSIKALALVFVFPIILIVGIISSNAILASLVGALSIDMSQTFGGTLFSIAAQSANKYRVYADNDQRTAVSQEVTFYIDANGNAIVYSDGTTSGDNYTTYISNYDTYITKITEATTKKYTVNSIFELVNPRKARNWTGYCVALDVGGENVYYMVSCSSENKTAMFYYLRNILQAKVMTKDVDKNTAIGITRDDQYSSIYKDLKKKFEASGEQAFIKGINLSGFGDDTELIKACYNTWGYTSVYKESKAFNVAEEYNVLNSDTLQSFGLSSISNAKLMFNSDEISAYFDGGQFGVVQKQAEYYVMADVVDFMNDSGAKLYMIDATSNMIKWNYEGHTVDSRWISSSCVNPASTAKSTAMKYKGKGDSNFEVLPFVVSYSEECQDSEAGNVLYLPKYHQSSELDGTVYIMCWKVANDDGTNTNANARYVPLVNGVDFEDPQSKEVYNFKSDYFSNNYKGVVVAKGIFETASTNANLGEPTYIKTTAKTDGTFWGNLASKLAGNAEEMFYYQMKEVGYMSQYFVDNTPEYVSYTSVESLNLSSSFSNISVVWEEKEGASDDIVWVAKEGTGEDEDGDGVEDLINKSFSPAMVQDLTIRLKKSDGSSAYAQYAGQMYKTDNNNTVYMFGTNDNSFFFVKTANDTGAASVLSVTNYTKIDVNQKGRGPASTGQGALNSVKKDYKFVYCYKDDSLSSEKVIESTTVSVNFFEYAKSKGGKSLFQTMDMQFIKVVHDGKTLYEKSLYVNSYFKTNSTNLISFKTHDDSESQSKDYVTMVFAEPYGNTDPAYTYRTSFYEFDLYGFYVGGVGSKSSYTLYKYDIDSKTSDRYQKDADGEYVLDADNNKIDIQPGLTLEVGVDTNDFNWSKESDSIGLYDGKNYVAMIYKYAGTVVNSTSSLPTITTKLLYDYKEYYNIATQNLFPTQAELNSYYNDIRDSLIIGFYRDNAGGIVGTLNWFANLIEWDVNIALFGGWRFKFVLAPQKMTNEEIAGYFTLEDGISFDYFFERTTVQELNNEGVGLATFFMPTKISYWIILIASALIIKVLGTALWGVIKRFYEITLLFIAMPAVASTIPLDNGERFRGSIQTQLISKVLGTYGVILGINAFFVLLAPVKSMSNIFTAEDIATSGSYFLKHLPIGPKLLNSYVYILFVLVAFTMIDALPTTISQIVGSNDDILAKGQQTKQQVGQAMDQAGDVISGKSLAKGAKQIAQKAGNFIPGSAFMKPLVEKASGFMKGDGSDSGGGDGDSSSRGDESMEAPSDSSGGGEAGGGDASAELAGGGDDDAAARADMGGGDAELAADADPMESLSFADEGGLEISASAIGGAAGTAVGPVGTVVGMVAGAAIDATGEVIEQTIETAGDIAGIAMQTVGNFAGDVVNAMVGSGGGDGKETADVSAQNAPAEDNLQMETPELIEKSERVNELNGIINDNLADGFDTAEDSVEYYDEMIKEEDEVEAGIAAEEALRAGWIDAAGGGDDFVFANDAMEHDEKGLPYKKEIADSSERLRKLKERRADIADAKQKKGILVGALDERSALAAQLAGSSSSTSTDSDDSTGEEVVDESVTTENEAVDTSDAKDAGADATEGKDVKTDSADAEMTPEEKAYDARLKIMTANENAEMRENIIAQKRLSGDRDNSALVEGMTAEESQEYYKGLSQEISGFNEEIRGEVKQRKSWIEAGGGLDEHGKVRFAQSEEDHAKGMAYEDEFNASSQKLRDLRRKKYENFTELYTFDGQDKREMVRGMIAQNAPATTDSSTESSSAPAPEKFEEPSKEAIEEASVAAFEEVADATGTVTEGMADTNSEEYDAMLTIGAFKENAAMVEEVVAEKKENGGDEQVLLDDMSMQDSFDYYNGIASEIASANDGIKGEIKKRRGWIEAGGYDENGNVRFAQNDEDHEKGMAFEDEFNASTERIRELREKKRENIGELYDAEGNDKRQTIKDMMDAEAAQDEAEITEKSAKMEELGATISENSIDGMSADESIEYYDGIIAEAQDIDAQIEAEKAKRTQWIQNAVDAGKAEAGTDDYVTANDSIEHDELNLPYKKELAESSDRLRELEEKKASMAGDVAEAESKKQILQEATAESSKLGEEVEAAKARQEARNDGVDRSQIHDITDPTYQKDLYEAAGKGVGAIEAAKKAEEAKKADNADEAKAAEETKTSQTPAKVEEDVITDEIRVLAGNAQIGKADRVADGTLTGGAGGINPGYDDLRALVAQLEARVSTLESEINAKQEQLADPNLDPAERAQIEQELAVQEGEKQQLENLASEIGEEIPEDFDAVDGAEGLADEFDPADDRKQKVKKIAGLVGLGALAVAAGPGAALLVGGGGMLAKKGFDKFKAANPEAAEKFKSKFGKGALKFAKGAGLVALGLALPGGFLTVGAGMVAAKGVKGVFNNRQAIMNKLGSSKLVKAAGLVGGAALVSSMPAWALVGAGAAAVGGVLVAKNRIAKKAATADVAAELAKKGPMGLAIGKKVSEAGGKNVPVNGTRAVGTATPIEAYGEGGPKGAGQIIAGVANGDVDPAVAADKVTVDEFNRQALEDREFVDDKVAARANVVKNRVDSKVGRVIANQALVDYGAEGDTLQDKIQNAINGDGKKEGLLSNEMKKQAVLATLTGADLDSFNAMSADKQAQYMKNNVKSSVGLDGKISFSVAGANVDSATANNLVSQMLSSDKIGDEAINNAIVKTNLGANVDAALSKNLSLGVDFNTENASTASSMLANSVYEKASKNDDIVAEAMLRHIESNKGTELFSRFQDEFNLSSESDLNDSTTRARVLEQIKMFKGSENPNVINSLAKNDYSSELTSVVKEQVQGGKFKVSAWDLADNSSRDQFKQKTAANLAAMAGHSILNGATVANQNEILSNAAVSVMRRNGSKGISSKIQSLAFEANISDKELKGIDPSVIKALTGKDSAGSLTGGDKELLGFVKAANGSFNGINAQNASQFIKDFKNSDSRISAFMKVSTNARADAIAASGQKGALAQMATQDASIALSDKKINELQTQFVKDGGISDGAAQTHLANLYKQQTGKDFAYANSGDISQFLSTNAVAKNLVMSEMKNADFDFARQANDHYQVQYARTKDEAAKEQQMAVEQVLSNAPESLYHAFVASNTEGKATITNDLFTKVADIGSENSAGYKDALKAIKGNFDSTELATYMTDNGLMEQDLVAAYKKAELLGQTKNGFNFATLSKYTGQSDAVDKDILNAIEAKTDPAEFKKMANDLVHGSLTSDQRQSLAESVASSGFDGLSKADQDALLQGGKFTKADFAGLSYHELMARKEGKTSFEVYDAIRQEVAVDKSVDKTLETQGDLITTDRLKEEIDTFEGTSEAVTYLADTYSSKVSMLSKSEEDAERRKASLGLIGADKVAEIEASDAYKGSVDKAVTHAMYHEFATSADFKNEVDQIRKGDLYKQESKKAGFNEEAFIVEELESRFDGRNLHGGENKERFERVRQAARENLIISAAANEDGALGTQMMAAADDAVDLANRRRIAAVMSAETNKDGLSRNDLYADAISSNAALFNKANNAFRAASGGKDLDSVDMMTRNSFLANEFANSLSGRDKKWFDAEKMEADKQYVQAIAGGDVENTIKKMKNANGRNYLGLEDYIQHQGYRGLTLDQALINDGLMNTDAVNNLSSEDLNKVIAKGMKQDEFNAIYSEAKRENYGEETDVFKNVKRDIIREQITDKEAALTPAVNLDNMSADEKEKFNLSKNLIQQSIRNDDNPAVLANAFRNVNLLDTRKMLADMYAANGLGPTDGKSIDELKKGLSNEQINNYLKSNETVKDQLINHVSANALLGMDEETKNARQTDAVLGNTALSNKVAMEMIGGMRDKKVNDGIKEMLVQKAHAQQVQEDKSIRERLGVKANASESEIMTALRASEGTSKDNFAANKNMRQVIDQLGGDFTTDPRIIEKIKNDTALLANLGLKKGASDEEISSKLIGEYDETKDKFVGRHKNADLVARSLAFDLYQDSVLDKFRGDTATLQSMGLKAGASDDEIMAKLKAQSNAAIAQNAVKFSLANKSNRSELEEAAFSVNRDGQAAKKYIENNKGKLTAEFAKDRLYETDANGNLKVKEGQKSEFNRTVEKLKGSSNSFNKSVYNEVTRAIDPSNNMDSAARADFFRSQVKDSTTSHIMTPGQMVDAAGNKIKGVKAAFDSFVQDKGKGSFWNAVSQSAKIAGQDAMSGAGVGVQAMWYKVSKKLPEASAAYDNWNRVLDKKIQDIKNGGGQYANMSKSAREAEVAKYAAQKIDQKLPENFANMSNEQQRAYTDSQNKLKHEAMTAGNFSSLYKAGVKATAVQQPSALKKIANNIGYNLNFTGALASQEVKDKHKQDLTDIDARIARYNATKAMRNKNVDFGSNFGTFLNTYMSKAQSTTVLKQTNNTFLKQYEGKTDKNGKAIDANFKFSDLTQKQQEALVKMREDAFATKMNRMHVVASKKVARDNGTDPRSYLEQKGIQTETVRYKDASKKYTHVQSKVNLKIPGVNWAVNKAISLKRESDIKKYDEEYARTGGAVSEKTKARYQKSYYGMRSLESSIQTQNKAIELQKTFDKMAEFNRNYKGNGRDYAKAFQQEFGQIAKDMYNRYSSRLNVGTSDGKLKIGKLDLSTSPVAVQQREVMKQIQEQMQKTSSRMKYGSAYIPATSSNGYVYVGKTLTNAKTSTEVKLDKMHAEDVNKALRQFNAEKKTLTYENLFNKLKPSLQEGFNAYSKNLINSKKFRDASDDQRKDMLGKYLERQLVKANNVVHNNNFLRSDASQLQKLNGTYVKKSSVNNTGVSRTMMAALTTNQSKIYQNIVNNYNTTQRKYSEEQAHLARLGAALKDLRTGVQSTGSRAQIVKIREQINSSTVKLSVLKKEYDSASARKRTFERKIIEEKTVRAPGRGPAGYNSHANVFDHYRFPMRGGGYITPTHPRARETAMAVSYFMRRYRADMNRLKLDVETMVKNNVLKTNSSLNAQIKSLVKKQTSDFGVALKDLNSTIKAVKSEISRLENSTSRKDRQMRSELENHRDRLESAQTELKAKFTGLGIELKEITRKQDNLDEKIGK